DLIVDGVLYALILLLPPLAPLRGAGRQGLRPAIGSARDMDMGPPSPERAGGQVHCRSPMSTSLAVDRSDQLPRLHQTDHPSILWIRAASSLRSSFCWIRSRTRPPTRRREREERTPS